MSDHVRELVSPLMLVNTHTSGRCRAFTKMIITNQTSRPVSRSEKEKRISVARQAKRDQITIQSKATTARNAEQIAERNWNRLAPFSLNLTNLTEIHKLPNQPRPPGWQLPRKLTADTVQKMQI